MTTEATYTLRDIARSLVLKSCLLAQGETFERKLHAHIRKLLSRYGAEVLTQVSDDDIPKFAMLMSTVERNVDKQKRKR